MRNAKGQFVKGIRSSPETEFKKGDKTWNKDLKGLHLSPESEWKKGDTAGEKSPSWKGGIQHIKNDCVHIRTGVNQRERRPKLVYEKHFGKIKTGMIIYHKDGNKDNDEPTNLELISRKELLKRNLRRYK